MCLLKSLSLGINTDHLPITLRTSELTSNFAVFLLCFLARSFVACRQDQRSDWKRERCVGYIPQDIYVFSSRLFFKLFLFSSEKFKGIIVTSQFKTCFTNCFASPSAWLCVPTLHKLAAEVNLVQQPLRSVVPTLLVVAAVVVASQQVVEPPWNALIKTRNYFTLSLIEQQNY